MTEALTWLAVIGGGGFVLLYLSKSVIDYYFGRKREFVDELVRKQQKEKLNGQV